MSFYGILILRVGLGIVFLYFGFNQIIEPKAWIDLVPSIFSNFVNLKIFIYLNGIFDLIIGICLILGLFIKIISLLGFLHLISIFLFSLKFTPSGIRDLGLAFAILSLYFLDEDRFNIKNFFRN